MQDSECKTLFVSNHACYWRNGQRNQKLKGLAKVARSTERFELILARSVVFIARVSVVMHIIAFRVRSAIFLSLFLVVFSRLVLLYLCINQTTKPQSLKNVHSYRVFACADLKSKTNNTHSKTQPNNGATANTGWFSCVSHHYILQIRVFDCVPSA